MGNAIFFNTFKTKSRYYFHLVSKMGIWAHKLSELSAEEKISGYGTKTDRLGRAGEYRRMCRRAMKKADKYLAMAIAAMEEEK
ncbi:MAG: hypothetical protein DRH04_05715 [Deltaproteobacteria bacterium]|nr:MAG: hypothetical protein DRH04_05715 [Deltaproteobacteria bacterium]